MLRKLIESKQTALLLATIGPQRLISRLRVDTTTLLELSWIP